MMAPRKAKARPTTQSAKIYSQKVAPNPIEIRKEKAPQAGKPVFKGMKFSLSGNFGDGHSHEKMSKWIEHHAGAYESEVSIATTHLICTIEDYKNKTEQVRKALNIAPACYIIVSDWLDDCLTRSKKYARVEKPYTLDKVLKRQKQSSKKKHEYRYVFEKGVQAADELVDNRLNHVYVDQSGFEYKVVCTRVNDYGSVKLEKYTIYLFETNAKPHTYMTGAKLSRGVGHKTVIWNDQCKPKHFKDAFLDFKGFFFKRTGISWDDRYDNLPYNPSNFKYHAPPLGRPIGVLPEGKNLPKFHVGEKA